MTDFDCRSCKDWRACIGKEEYLFAHLRFCPFQCLWILANADILHTGKWPPQYSIEEPRKKQINNEGYFVKPALVIAEVEKRLETCGTTGKLLIAEAKVGETLETLSDEAFEVLMFVKGFNRKRMSFNAWKWQRNYRKRIGKTNQDGL